MSADLEWFVDVATTVGLGERQAEAFYRRATGQSRGAAADAMACTKSNVDNLERDAKIKVARARALLELVGAIRTESYSGSDDGGVVAPGVCAECGDWASVLVPDLDRLEMAGDWRAICPDCGGC